MSSKLALKTLKSIIKKLAKVYKLAKKATKPQDNKASFVTFCSRWKG